MYLGIDLGTSEVKVLLLAPDGTVVGTAGTPFSVSGNFGLPDHQTVKSALGPFW